MNIETIMTTPVHCVSPDTPVGEIRAIFALYPYHHLPVTDGQELLGIISDRDVLGNLSPYTATDLANERDNELLQRTAAQIMTTQVITADPDTAVETAAILLLENHISCLPVVSGTVLEGIVTWKDLLKYFLYRSET
jgi:acetoin utilization protein AcuB